MNKTGVAVAVVVLAGGAWWAAAAYTSHRFEQAYRDQIAAVQKKFPFVQVSDVKTQSGLTGGSYSGKISLNCGPATAKLPLSIGFEQQVQYGPFPGASHFGAAYVNSHLVLGDNVPAAVRSAIANLKIEDVHTLYGYDGGFETKLRMPAGSYAADGSAGQAKLQWSDVQFEVSGNQDGSLMRYHGTVPQFAMNVTGSGEQGAHAGSFMIKGLDMQGESTGSNVWLRPGTQSFLIDHMDVSSDGAGGQAKMVSLDKLAVKGEGTINQNLLDMHATYSIGDISVPLSASEKLQLANFEMEGSLKHLDAGAMEKALAQMMQTISSQCQTGQADPQAQLAAVMKAAADFNTQSKAAFLHDPEYSLDKFAVDFDGKRGELSAKARVQGLTQADLDGPPEALRAKLMQAASVQAQGKMPLAWISKAMTMKGMPADQAAAQAKAMADMAVQRGFAVLDGDFLSSKFTFENGAALVNGKPLGQPAAAAPGQ